MPPNDSERNLAAMAEHGINVGETRRRSPSYTVTVIAPAENWPRNGRGLVRCTMTYHAASGPTVEETHFWPETLAHYPVEVPAS